MVFEAIYDNSFLDPAIKYLLSPVLDHVADKYPMTGKRSLASMLNGDLHPVLKQVANNLMGVFLGYATENKSMIRSSLIELVITKQIEQQQLEGFIAILLGDISCQNQIESFCQKAGISGTMLINLIKLLDKNAHDLYSNIL
jgi:hypothetical protein